MSNGTKVKKRVDGIKFLNRIRLHLWVRRPCPGLQGVSPGRVGWKLGFNFNIEFTLEEFRGIWFSLGGTLLIWTIPITNSLLLDSYFFLYEKVYMERYVRCLH